MFRGPPGTGKTTLIVAIFAAMGCPCIVGWNFIDVVTSEPTLFRHFPKLRRDTGLAKLGALLERSPVRRTVSRVALDRLINTIRTGQPVPILERHVEGAQDDFEASSTEAWRGDRDRDVGIWWSWPPDREPDGAESEDEEATPELVELARIYEYAERCDAVPALIVVDSLEGLAKRYGILASSIVSTLQQDLADSRFARIIFVIESEASSRLDALVDGVIRFDTIHHADRRIGVLEIALSRGQPVRQRRHGFVWENGHSVFLPTDAEIVERLLLGVDDSASGLQKGVV